MSYNLSVDVKYFKTYCDLAEFVQSQVIKTSKTFLVGNKFYNPLSVHWTFEFQASFYSCKITIPMKL